MMINIINSIPLTLYCMNHFSILAEITCYQLPITSGRRWDCSGLGHVARRCFGTKWYDDVPGARSTRDGDTGNEDNSSFAWFFKLDKYAMFSFAMTSGLASDFDKFKIIITLRRAQKFGDTGPYKNFDFLYNPLLLFFNFSWNHMLPIGNIMQ